MIETRDIRYKYPESQPLSFPDITINSGEQWLLKGLSGSGKTTLLHLLAGILSPSHGRVTVDNVSLENLAQSSLDRFRANTVGLIFQKHLFISALNMYQNLQIPNRVAGGETGKERINQLLEELNISSLASKKPSQLSQGELQRFSVARALVNRPKLVLADEPTSSLDDTNCLRFIELLKTTCQEHEATLLIATHDARIEAHFKEVIQIDQEV